MRAFSPPNPASVTAPIVAPAPVAGTVQGTSVGTGAIPAPPNIILTSTQLGDIIKAAVTQSMYSSINLSWFLT